MTTVSINLSLVEGDARAWHRNDTHAVWLDGSGRVTFFCQSAETADALAVALNAASKQPKVNAEAANQKESSETAQSAAE